MERRSFLKMSAALSAAATVSGCNSSSKDADVVPPQPPVGEEKVNWSSCLVNCGSNCPIKVFSRDGVITRVETDHEVEDVYGLHQVRACARGRSLRQRTYAPDRLKRPMKRVGERGDAAGFVPISWEEAVSTIAQKLKEAYAVSPKSVFRSYGSGAYYGFASNANFNRLFNLCGGYLNAYGNYSWAQQMEAAKHTFGTGSTMGSATATLDYSDFFLGIAYNPNEIRQSGSGEGYDFVQALKRNTRLKKMVMIDPRYTDSMLGKEDMWLPIRPGTDAAFAEAVAYVMISSTNWFNSKSKPFIDKYCFGFDYDSVVAQKAELIALADKDTSGKSEHLREYSEALNPEENYRDYILGQGIYSIQRTPEWAEKITGIAADTIKEIADELMGAKAPYIVVGAGVNRQANGEQSMRALYMLSVLTGKLGIEGASNGELPRMTGMGRAGIPTGDNPVKESISFFTWSEAINHGETMTARTHGVRGTDGLDAPLGANIKFIFSASDSSLLNQHAEINNTAQILRDAQDLFVVSCDCWMTPGAKFADIILPDTSWLESNDLVDNSYAAGSLGYLTAMSAAVEPMWECKSMYEIAALIADEMGVGNEFRGEHVTEEAWLDYLYKETVKMTANNGVQPAFPATYKEAQQIGVFRKDMLNRHVALQDFVNDPVGNKLATPTGKIEIASSELAWRAKYWTQEDVTGVKGDTITAIPQYTVTWDGYEDKDTATDYPLQLATYHTKGRTHSSYHNVPWLREAVEDALWMNQVDADEKGLSSGDMVEVYNERGSIEVPVKITPRVAPNVVALGQGAWYLADAKGRTGATGKVIDVGGAVNTLTRYQPSPVAKGNPQLTIRVQIRKA
ncbi:molybdopterin-dependent oxidoreductase [Shewanella corallii]|uniref:Molybdopterin-dependent oxidoreductase n=1 Tax=Shewanella corallii TaxID=560080 RepID=A0ABT0NBL1_9GAMM|nr:DMSO/selenate family reductase complex A subunit [Shewanella corallii]MCL2915226.1 molybdopterin-dependent oxidoreductase [Shewanella corallii]